MMKLKQEPEQKQFIKDWLMANTIGIVSGGFIFMGVEGWLQRYIISNIPETISYPIAGGIIGLLVGFLQANLVLASKVNKIKWIIATGIGGFIYAVCSGFVSSFLPELFVTVYETFPCPDHCYHGELADTWVKNIIAWGILLGLTVGICQWAVLHRDYPHSHVWIITMVISGILAFALLGGYWFLWQYDFLALMSWCLTSPILFSLLTGGALYRLLYKRKPHELD